MSKQRTPGSPVFWALLAASVIGLAAYWLIACAAAARGCLREWTDGGEDPAPWPDQQYSPGEFIRPARGRKK